MFKILLFLFNNSFLTKKNNNILIKILNLLLSKLKIIANFKKIKKIFR